MAELGALRSLESSSSLLRGYVLCSKAMVPVRVVGRVLESGCSVMGVYCCRLVLLPLEAVALIRFLVCACGWVALSQNQQSDRVCCICGDLARGCLAECWVEVYAGTAQ